MKKLLLILLSVFIISCANGTGDASSSGASEKPAIPRSQWDKDNIAYTNIGNPTRTYPYLRKSGSTGIIGTFEDSHYEISGMTGSTQTTIYTFNDTGYFEYSNISARYNNHDSGTFIIYTSTKTTDYYVLKTTSSEGHGYNWYFYQVSNDKFDLQPYIIVNGSSVYPDGYTGIQ